MSKRLYSLVFTFLCLVFFNATSFEGISSLGTHKVNTKISSFYDFGDLLSLNNDPETDKEIGKAIGAFNKLNESGNFTNTINPNELTEFPIGIKENVSNVEYGLVVTKAKFTPEYAVINVYARMVTPQSGVEGGKKILYFGAEGIKLSYNGRIIGDAKLSLLGNVHIPFNKKQWMLTLEGGNINKSNGESVNHTYVSIDCDGIKELSLKGNVQISRKVLVPLDATGKIIPGDKNRVRGDFLVKGSDWNDILVNVSISPFAITSQTKNKDKGYFSFNVNNAVLDLSDLRTDPSVVFPQRYNDLGYLVAGRESWRGLYVETLYVGLPEEIKTKSEVDTRVSLEAHHLLIDTYGVSGKFSANNVFSLDEGITSKKNAWNYSLDHIGVDFAASKIVGASLSGKIQLPIQKLEKNNSQDSNNVSQPIATNDSSQTENTIATNTTASQANRKYLSYQGLITEKEYMISISSIDNLDFSIWSAKATIDSGSSIELNVKNRRFLPKAILNGSLQIRANSSIEDDNEDDANKIAKFDGIRFEGLVLQTEAPFITADYFGVEGEQKLAGFNASIKNIYVQLAESEANLGFEITVGLQKNRFSASGGMQINGEIKNENRAQKWRYKGFQLTQLGFRNVDVGVAKISGALEIMDKDPLYGKGFKASLEAKDIKGLSGASIGVNAVFGRSTFRYWGFEGSVNNLNISTPSGVNITGFTGGAFYHMLPDREKGLLNKNKAFVLLPDDTVGLALRGGVYGNVRTDKVASFMAAFNVSTNPNGGIANIGFLGEATIMSDLSSIFSGGVFQKVQDKFRDITGNSNFVDDLRINDKVKKVAKSFLDIDDVNEQYPLEESINSAIYAKMAMNYDFNNNVFHATLDAYVNAANGVIKGLGTNGRAGWAVLHIAPDDWYMHIGTPTDMIGLRVGFDKFSLESGSYFMVGNHIPASPAPPIEVATILGVDLDDIDYMKNLNTLGEGKGFAFGTHLQFDTGDMSALFLYARFQAGLGTDIMLKNYGQEAKCSNRGGDQIGINGWYANGQAYVYLQGELGIKIKLWFVKKRIPIIKAGAAALLQAKGPNPYWARGYLGGHYNLLGGMIKGKFRFKLEFGEECKLENESVLGGMKIITDLTPDKGDTEVDVFAIPQATFAFNVNQPIVIPEDDRDHTYKIIVDKMTIIDDQGNEVVGTIEYNNSNDVAEFVSEDILPPNKTMKAIVEVSFMEKINGIYQVVMVDGVKATEREERSFTTGTAPNHIPLTNIKYAYPVVNQKNYYREETNNGFIKLKRGQDYLFEDDNWTTSSQFVNEDNEIPSGFSYNQSTNMVNFEVPNLFKQKEYTFSIIAKNSKANTDTSSETVTEKEEQNNGADGSSITTERKTKKAKNVSKDGVVNRLSYTFRTSKYKTLARKISAINFNTLSLYVSSDVVSLQNNMNMDEYFDTTELVGSRYTDNQPLIQLTALMDDSFANKFKTLFYNNYPIDGLVLDRADSEEDTTGIPPNNAFPLFTSYLLYLDEQDGNSLLKTVFPYKYDLFRYYKSDWYDLISKAASKYVDTPISARPSAINQLLQSTYGIAPKQKYKVKAQYILPGKQQGSEKEFNYQLK